MNEEADSQAKTEEQMEEVKEHLMVQEDEGSLIIDRADLDVDGDISAKEIAEHYLEEEGVYKVTVKDSSDDMNMEYTSTRSRMIQFDQWMELGGWEMLDYETKLDAEVLNWYYRDIVRKERKSDNPPDQFYVSIDKRERGEFPKVLGSYEGSTELAEIIFDSIYDEHVYKHWYLFEGADDLSPDDVVDQIKDEYDYDVLMVSDKAHRKVEYSRIIEARVIDPNLQAILAGWNLEYLQWLNLSEWKRIPTTKFVEIFWVDDGVNDSSLLSRDNAPILRTPAEHSGVGSYSPGLRNYSPDYGPLHYSSTDDAWPEENAEWQDCENQWLNKIWKLLDAINLGHRLIYELERDGYPEHSETVRDAIDEIADDIQDLLFNEHRLLDVADRTFKRWRDSDEEDFRDIEDPGWRDRRDRMQDAMEEIMDEEEG